MAGSETMTICKDLHGIISGGKGGVVTFFPCFASPIPKLLVVVVFPTPPFWFAIAIILHMVLFLRLL